MKCLVLTAFIVTGLAGTSLTASATRSGTNSDEAPVDGDEAEVQDGDILPISETEPLPAPEYTIPDDADFTYEETEFKIVDHYDPGREPMNGKRTAVSYKGVVCPAYYWAPGKLVVLQVSLADEDIPSWDELSQEDKDTWKSFLDDDFESAEEAYYAQMLPTYTFWFDFEKNKIVPFVEFDYGTDGKVVMMEYNEDQMYYLEELSPSFLKLTPFEFETYQFLSVNDDSCYHVLSCMDQLGNTYLYQYDANGNSCARVDLNMLIGLRYLAERTIALNEYIDKVQAYQDNIRKIIAVAIVIVVVAVFAFIYLTFGRKKKKGGHDDDYDEDEDDDDRGGPRVNPFVSPDFDDYDDGTVDLEKGAEKQTISADDLDKLTARYTASETENFKRDVLEELHRKKEPEDDGFVLPEIAMPDDLDLPEETENVQNAAGAKSEGALQDMDSIKEAAALQDMTLMQDAAEPGDTRELPEPSDVLGGINEPSPAQDKQQGSSISMDDLEKLTLKYTGSDSDIFKMNVLEELSEEGFKPEFDDGDPTEGGLFYAADTDVMKDMFRPAKGDDDDDEEELSGFGYEDDDEPRRKKKRRKKRDIEYLFDGYDDDDEDDDDNTDEVRIFAKKPPVKEEEASDDDVLDLNDL